MLEFGARFLRAGYAGENSPRHTFNFGPSEQRRVGDYREWLPVHLKPPRKESLIKHWGLDHQLWPLDLRDAELGLIEDKIERAVREARVKYFLSDSKLKRVIAAVPSITPRPLLTSLLTIVFMTLNPASVTLLPSPVLCTVSAGLRSALVVDIGWAETVVTTVYEYREVQQKRSQRAGRLLGQEMAKVLRAETAKQHHLAINTPSFKETEEVLETAAWCWDREAAQKKEHTSPSAGTRGDDNSTTPVPDASIRFDFRSKNQSISVQLPFQSLALPAEVALFANNTPTEELDDHNQPLHMLIYRALLSLPVDVRRDCFSRLVLVGGVSHLPGLKRRIVQELQQLVHIRGWDPVWNYGSAKNTQETRRRQQSEAKNPEQHKPGPVSAEGLQQEPDWWEDKMRRGAKHSKADMANDFRVIESLGAWAGASLVANMRIKGIVEIEKDRFLQHGLAGATKEKEPSVVQQRQSFGPGGRSGAGERSSWTLGIWT